ncbi:MAG TPA: TolC family protein [Gemmatimonadaceae bacterium]|nr:TolC family protein [Gemmatimonadaceae bacterium]
MARRALLTPTTVMPFWYRITLRPRVRSPRPALALSALLVAGALPAAGAQSAPGAPGATAPTPAGWTLDDVLRAVLSRHPLVEAAQARVSAARGSRRSAGALPNPVVTYQVENAAFPGQSVPAGTERETQTFLTLPLEPLYQRWPRVRQADEEVRAAEAAFTSTRRQVALDAARAYYRVALAQVSVATAEEVRAGLVRLEQYNRARVTEGAAPEGDYIRVQVELARAETDVALEGVELARARAELAPYLGAPAVTSMAQDSLAVAVPTTLDPGAALPALEELTGRARRSRPDILAAQARAAAARADVRYQRALTVRQVGATFGSKRVAGENTMLAGLSLPIPLFDQNRGEVQRASGDRLAAEQELAWVERTAVAQLQAAYEATRRLTDQVAALQGSFLSRAEESRRIALAAYEEGAASLLQVLDASRTLGEARLTYYRALFAQRESLLELNVAAGSEPVGEILPSQSSGAAEQGQQPASHRPGASQ